jgi:hypothetical protein
VLNCFACVSTESIVSELSEVCFSDTATGVVLGFSAASFGVGETNLPDDAIKLALGAFVAGAATIDSLTGGFSVLALYGFGGNIFSAVAAVGFAEVVDSEAGAELARLFADDAVTGFWVDGFSVPLADACSI